MRRFFALFAVVAVLLTGCAPSEFDPQTGDGYPGLIAGFEALSPEEQLSTVASHNAAAERELWAMSGIDEALGGSKAADEVFAQLQGQLAATVDSAEKQDAPFVLASYADDVTEAQGAGMFAGMMVGNLLADAGLIATKDGATGNAVQDFGKGGQAEITATEDGTVTTTFNATMEHKGVQITLAVGTTINPCPDADGALAPQGIYQVVVEGPNGTGVVVQVEIEMDILVNDNAEIALSDYAFDAVYLNKPMPSTGALIDTSGAAVEFSVGLSGEVTEHKVAGFAEGDFADDALKTGAFLANWVSTSLEKAAMTGWESGRCVDLSATYSAGPTGLKPNADVTITASPVAKSDGKPTRGTVTAELTGGAASVSPSATKVPAKPSATFAYTAPSEQDKSGTVRLESRSNRGVGLLEVTFDTKAITAYAVTGASGTICDITKPFTLVASGVTSSYVPADKNGGTFSYEGSMAGGRIWGGDVYSITYEGDIAKTMHMSGMGYVEAAGRQVGAPQESETTLIPFKERPAECG